MTPDDYAALFAESRDEPAFSNGDEGLSWTGANCDTCIHDKPAREGDDANGCPLVLITLLGRTPKQFIDGPRNDEGLYARETQYVCTEYRHEDEGPADPQPITTPPGQGELLPREPYEGVRMLKPLTPAEERTAAAYQASADSWLPETFADYCSRTDAATDTARSA